MDDWELQVWQEACTEAEQYDLVRQRVRFVFFPSSGHAVVIIDDAVMFSVRAGEIRPRKKRDGYSGIDVLAEEILADVPYDQRTVDCLLRRAERNARRLR